MYLSVDYQERFLADIIGSQSTVSIYLKNGVKLTGKIIAATRDVIFMNSPVPQVIYKKQVSTILPLQSINEVGQVP